MNKISSKIFCIILFLLLFSLGILLAQHKPLWNDELFTQVQGVEKLSYGEIIAGKIPEANNAPLFYLLQKTTCQAAQFKFPIVWHEEWNVSDPQSQIILRISSNIFVSLALVLIVYFFLKYYSWVSAVFVFLVSLSSVMVWAHWAEARPYALWMLFSTVQMLLFLTFFRREDSRPLKASLIGVHWLLAFTAVSSAVQIIVTTGLLWMFRKITRKDLLALLVGPFSICLIYYILSPHFKFFLPVDPFGLIWANFPPEWLGIFLICLCFSIYKNASENKFYLAFIGSMFW